MRSDLAVGVVIPACDEESTVGATISSVRRSLAAARVERSSIVVVADGCRDDTVAAARARLRPGDEVVEVAYRSVGAARADGALVAMRRLEASAERCWLLSIDADSTASVSWVIRHLRHAIAGIECVAGVVELDRHAPPALRDAFARRYVCEGRERQDGHVHGTNLGIRGDTLVAAGNWSPWATGEDQALWAAVGSLGRRRLQDPGIAVRTSARLFGRAPRGFARDLRELVASDRPVLQSVGPVHRPARLL